MLPSLIKTFYFLIKWAVVSNRFTFVLPCAYPSTSSRNFFSSPFTDIWLIADPGDMVKPFSWFSWIYFSNVVEPSSTFNWTFRPNATFSRIYGLLSRPTLACHFCGRNSFVDPWLYLECIYQQWDQNIEILPRRLAVVWKHECLPRLARQKMNEEIPRHLANVN